MEQKFKIQNNFLLGVSFAKSLNYTLQSLWLPAVDRILNGKSDRNFANFAEHLKLAAPKIQMLLQQDSENILNGVYPTSVLADENIILDWLRLPKVIADSVRANNQKKLKKYSDFDQEALSLSEDMPEYYKRNFHFQKNGYLSDDSAELYEQQVEILFSGTAQVMRRQIIKPLKDHFKTSDGKGLKILEVGSGTGSLSKSLALAMPKAQITCLDLSPHYLKKAREHFKKAKNINFVQGLAENLPFKNNTYDAVVSCYLFHELPWEVRMKVLTEKWRVLKKDGFLGIADSIQSGDDDELQFALDQFPKDFHEPFYKNYIGHSLESMFKNNLGVSGTSQMHFLTKTIFATKTTLVNK